MLVIHGVLFEMIDRKWIREPFKMALLHDLDDLKTEDGFLKGYIHTKTKMIDGNYYPAHLKDPDVKPFWIPSELRRTGRKDDEQWTRQFNAISRKKGLGVIRIDKLMSKSLNHVLPEVLFEGRRYLLDMEHNRLKFEKDSEQNIRFPNMPILPALSNHFFIYQISSMELLPIDTPRLLKPEPIIVVEFPSPMLIDPIGTAMAVKQPPTTFLNEYAQQDFIKLKTYTMQDQNLPAKVRNIIESSVRFESTDAAFKHQEQQSLPGKQVNKSRSM